MIGGQDDAVMRNGDRFFRIIYRELFSLLPLKHGSRDVCCGEHFFNLADRCFCDMVKENYFSVYARDYSPDEVELLLCQQKQLLRGAGYQKASEGYNSLHLFLLYADALLYPLHGELRVRFDDLFYWDGFVNKVDSIIFQAAFLSGSQAKDISCTPLVRHDNGRLQKVLTAGLCENHMHLNGSGYTWEMNWANLVWGEPFDLRHIKKAQRNLDSKQISGPEFNLMLVKLQSIRSFLAAVAKDGGQVKQAWRAPMQAVIRANSEMEISVACKLQMVTMHHYGIGNYKLQTDKAQKYTLREREFLTNLFALFRKNKLSGWCIYLFNLYIAGMSYTKFNFVQDNIGMGFAKFKWIESIKEAYLEPNPKTELYESVFDKYYAEGCVKKIEFRIAPKRKADILCLIRELNKANEKIFKQHPKCEKIEFALIVHYIKQPPKLEKTSIFPRSRYQSIAEDTIEKASFLNQYFDAYQLHHPLLNRQRPIKLVAIDAANEELYCPPEVFGPVFRQHKARIKSVFPLGVTYHVGEDFASLASGLRNIDDAIEFFNLREGDRLGHANAMGIDAKTYFELKRNHIITTKQKYIDDLAWMHRLLHGTAEQDVLEYLAHEYERYARQLFQDICFNGGRVEYSLPVYQHSYILRGDAPTLYLVDAENAENYKAKTYELNFCNPAHKEAASIKQARILNHIYQYHTEYKKRGDETFVCQADEPYKRAVHMAQIALHNKVANLRLVVECNPSSNTKIAPIHQYGALPLWRLNRFGLGEPSPGRHRDIPVCINTDDSAIFQTNLGLEYALIALSLFEQGYGSEEVYRYIDYLRELSNQVTFVS